MRKGLVLCLVLLSFVAIDPSAQGESSLRENRLKPWFQAPRGPSAAEREAAQSAWGQLAIDERQCIEHSLALAARTRDGLMIDELIRRAVLPSDPSLKQIRSECRAEPETVPKSSQETFAREVTRATWQNFDAGTWRRSYEYDPNSPCELTFIAKAYSPNAILNENSKTNWDGTRTGIAAIAYKETIDLRYLNPQEFKRNYVVFFPQVLSKGRTVYVATSNAPSEWLKIPSPPQEPTPNDVQCTLWCSEEIKRERLGELYAQWANDRANYAQQIESSYGVRQENFGNVLYGVALSSGARDLGPRIFIIGYIGDSRSEDDTWDRLVPVLKDILAQCPSAVSP